MPNRLRSDERRLPCETLEGDAAERVDVTRGRCLSATDELGRRVVERPEHSPGPGQHREGDAPRDAEVRQRGRAEYSSTRTGRLATPHRDPPPGGWAARRRASRAWLRARSAGRRVRRRRILRLSATGTSSQAAQFRLKLLGVGLDVCSSTRMPQLRSVSTGVSRFGLVIHGGGAVGPVASGDLAAGCEA
jgi:hypothetical protein